MKRKNADGSFSVGGIVSREPEQRQAGERIVTKFSLRWVDENAELDESGRKKATFMDIDCWDSQALMLQKGDHCEVTGTLGRREYNGKDYYSIRADYILPGMDVVARLAVKGAVAAVDAMDEKNNAPVIAGDDEGLPF